MFRHPDFVFDWLFWFRDSGLTGEPPTPGIHIGRRFFNFATLISLILCALTFAFTAIRSIRTPHMYELEIRDEAVARRSLALTGLIIAFAVLPVVSWLEKQFRIGVAYRRRRRGACPRCGHDLRGTPQRCAECGTVPSRS